MARGVCELKVDYGPGYRVYFGQIGSAIIVLLNGGDKKTQPKDIAKGKSSGEILRDAIMARKSKKPFRDYEEDLVGRLKDPEYAYEYLKAAIDEKDEPRIFMNALSHIAKAWGVRKLSAKTKLNRESLYRILSKDGNPTLTSLHAILDALGFKLSVEPKKKAVRRDLDAP